MIQYLLDEVKYFFEKKKKMMYNKTKTEVSNEDK